MEKLIRARGGKKHSLTSFKLYLNTFNDDYQFNNNNILELEKRVNRMEGIYQEFCELQLKIEDKCEANDLIAQYTERDTFETEYFPTVAKAETLINNYKKTQNATVASMAVEGSATRSNLGNVQLPSIKLPIFTGLYENWVEYRDLFNSLINTNSGINNTQKLQYLKSSLQGQAAQVIKSLEISETNYPIAWQLICDRYDNKKLLINNHVKALFNLTTVKNESAVELRKLLDDFSKNLLSLEALGQPVQHWSTLIIYMVSNNLDNQTKREWEISVLNDESPSINDMKLFLKGRCDLLETLENQNTRKTHTISKNLHKETHFATTSLVATREQLLKCNFCDSNDHLIYTCKRFLMLDARDRTAEAKTRNLCLNCLKRNHFSTECWAGKCRKCNKKHNSLLHYNNYTSVTKGDDNFSSQKDNEISQNTVSVNCTSNNIQKVLLSTAVIQVRDREGKYNFCRSLLDCGSESSFITTELCERLQLDKTKINISVMGINQRESNINYKTEINLQSCNCSYTTKVVCLVIDKITDKIPSNALTTSPFSLPRNIKMADPEFYKSSNIEILLGANVFWDLICPQRIKLGKNEPVIQKTVLGWVVAGPYIYNQGTQNIKCNLSVNDEVQNQLKTFWEIEECSNKQVLSTEDKFCEQHFTKTVTKDDNNRFVVSIPFKTPKQQLGNSISIATKRFNNLERRFDKNSNLKQQYVTFMREYKQLGHMSVISDPSEGIEGSYYLPHHGVIKQSSSTTKLRVVFDGSCKTTNNLSLNDIQYTGPIIQEELFNILLRFRMYKYVLSADVEKMYRQVLITPSQRNMQRILWRENSSEPIKHYALNTVTYGTASAPFLAIRSLQQLAHENQNKYPKAANVILHDFYVDDLLTGCNDIGEAVKLYKEIKMILESVGFKLRKWSSNNTHILNEINALNEANDILFIGDNKEQKTLGLIWDPKSDCLKYDVNNVVIITDTTKREMLSSISKIFDPLGLVGPCIIIAKIMLQELWAHNLGWDDVVPENINKKWNNFKNELSKLGLIQIPRFITCKNHIRLELHAFSDASEVAYGTCIYIRTFLEDGSILVNLLCAKSRVAPIKRITIPRLELCGALLSARLVSKVKSSLNIKFDKIIHWCDSEIVLHWIKMQSSNLKVFVGHRVAEIQEISDINNWFYVNTADNPADLISRGLLPSKLVESTWWKGPQWLAIPTDQWSSPVVPQNSNDIPDIKTKVLTYMTHQLKQDDFPFNYTHSLFKLKRTVAWCLRFSENCRANSENRKLGNLTVVELDEAMKKLVKLSQIESFSEELKYIKGETKTKFKGSFIHLSPFLDSDGLIRVGGRLKNSNFNYNKKHPLLLSGKHILTKLILEYEHIRLLHAGPQHILSSVREKFWPTAGKSLAKTVVYKCIKCYRVKPTQYTQIMGDLPQKRLVSVYPFYTTGVDYAGPFNIKSHKGRGSKILKCYISLFVCFATRAIHLEPVTDLTTDAFIATFRRFASRRGYPSHVYSDNGSNFIGAASKLKDLGNFIIKNNNVINSVFSKENIQWHFIPAHSPHFGGLWEAGVKSTKYHLRRVLGNALITFEDLLTILTQIEAVLNSRPLHPMSSSPDDFQALSPSHFLMGRQATALPDPNILEIPTGRLSRYEQLQQLVQHFWTRWSKEYISELQQRSKWTINRSNIKVGALVLIKEDGLPPFKWKIGRVSEVHPGSDGAVRVVSVKTATSLVKRAIVKICPLPISDDMQI
jgi:hypothetical protein